ncbi:hypothetical protein BC936DRAFT_138517, partial [Jimgerdemannia flammicorona]
MMFFFRHVWLSCLFSEFFGVGIFKMPIASIHPDGRFCIAIGMLTRIGRTAVAW